MGYLESTIKQFQYYEMLGCKTLARVEEKDLFKSFGTGSNDLATIVKHIAGNMTSRFTDFLTSDGEKSWRNRDTEFINDFENKMDVIRKWENGWKVFYDAIKPLTEDDLKKTVFIRNQEHSVHEAINRQLAHYAYHIGQMVYIGKIILGDKWESLSIPIGNSKTYNDQKNTDSPSKGHYTDEFLKNK